MKIEHLAIWVDDLERMKEFYSKYFDMQSGEKYTNSAKQCTSNFLHFGREMTRLEIMHKPGLQEVQPEGNSKRNNRTTGNGYYESVILDPEGNQVEITE